MTATGSTTAGIQQPTSAAQRHRQHRRPDRQPGRHRLAAAMMDPCRRGERRQADPRPLPQGRADLPSAVEGRPGQRRRFHRRSLRSVRCSPSPLKPIPSTSTSRRTTSSLRLCAIRRTPGARRRSTVRPPARSIRIRLVDLPANPGGGFGSAATPDDPADWRTMSIDDDDGRPATPHADPFVGHGRGLRPSHRRPTPFADLAAEPGPARQASSTSTSQPPKSRPRRRAARQPGPGEIIAQASHAFLASRWCRASPSTPSAPSPKMTAT